MLDRSFWAALLTFPLWLILLVSGCFLCIYCDCLHFLSRSEQNAPWAARFGSSCDLASHFGLRSINEFAKFRLDGNRSLEVLPTGRTSLKHLMAGHWPWNWPSSVDALIVTLRYAWPIGRLLCYVADPLAFLLPKSYSISMVSVHRQISRKALSNFIERFFVAPPEL